jgi:hypothetical protein
MRFFDEDNRQFETAVVAVVLLITGYVGSFAAIRANTASIECSIQSVDLPSAARTFYRPLIIWDKRLNSDVVYRGEEDQIRIAKHYFCGE